MDPNAHRLEQLPWAADIQNLSPQEFVSEAPFRTQAYRRAEKSERLAELVLALHPWIAHGGFLSEAWRRR